MPGRADDVLSAHLQVGRVLPMPWLGASVLLCNVVLGLLASSSIDDLLAPTWVVVPRIDDGVVLGRVFTGREAGIGEALLARVRADLEMMDVAEFLARWKLEGSESPG